MKKSILSAAAITVLSLSTVAASAQSYSSQAMGGAIPRPTSNAMGGAIPRPQTNAMGGAIPRPQSNLVNVISVLADVLGIAGF